MALCYQRACTFEESFRATAVLVGLFSAISGAQAGTLEEAKPVTTRNTDAMHRGHSHSADRDWTACAVQYYELFATTGVRHTRY